VLIFLLEFLEAVFHGVPMESLLDEDKGWSCNTRTTAQKGHNFLFDRLNTLKCLQEFLLLFFVEYLRNHYVVKMRGGSARPEQHHKKAITFVPTV